MIIFFNFHGVILKKLVPKDQAENNEYYLGVMQCLNNDSPVHSALKVKKFLAFKSITVIEHQPCSPDLVLPEYALFPKLRTALKESNFGSVTNIQRNVLAELKTNTIANIQLSEMAFFLQGYSCYLIATMCS